ncbi:MAG: hypothetical protein KBD83_04530 [Gammaproteobacteria bacterium]|nr:hypothetical protein [Gammaproteobacteria bacterium]
MLNIMPTGAEEASPGSTLLEPRNSFTTPLSASPPSITIIIPDAPLRAPSEILENAYKDEIKEEERFFLSELEREWMQSKPFLGKKILINAHMTLITLAQIKLFISAGAEVDATATAELVTHDDTINPILLAGISFYKNGDIPQNKRSQYYDIVYDCGAGMLDIVTPKIGMVELTHTDPALYNEISFPVITVDNSKTKSLETGFGTGDSAVRLLRKLSEVALMRLIKDCISPDSSSTLFFSPEAKSRFYLLLTIADINKWKSEKYMIFGCGKVGQGIANALKHAGVSEKNIYIVDVSVEAFMGVRQSGFNGIHLLVNESGAVDIVAKNKVTSALQSMNTVITATGVPGAISRFFDVEDFSAVSHLINMGTPDEFGHKFLPEQILNDKKPANFMLDRPTEVRFLDPIFWIWAYGGQELLLKSSLSKGLYDISKSTDLDILAKWMEKYPDIWSNSEREASLKPRDLHGLSRDSFNTLYQKFGILKKEDIRLTYIPCASPTAAEVTA